VADNLCVIEDKKNRYGKKLNAVWIDGNGCRSGQDVGGSCRGPGGGMAAAAMMLTPLREEMEGGEDAGSWKENTWPEKKLLLPRCC